MDMVTSALEDTKSGFNLIMLDACRDNPFASGRGGSRGLGVMGGGTAESMVVFATAPGSVAQDGDGRNSPFTSALKQHLATPDQEVRQLVAAVSRSVQEMTGGKQIPWLNTSFTGQFFFLTAQQQLAKAESNAKQLQGELETLEAEIAKRQSAIAAATDSLARHQLELEQQRAKAIENSKKLEVQRMEQIREQAAYQLAVQEKELAEKHVLEATVAGQQEELARQAEMRRVELAELDQKKSQSSDALQRLDLIAKMEKAIADIKESFALSITGTREELERLGLQQVSSYRITNPQDPWETDKEFEARVGDYQAALVAEGEAKIREIEKQRDDEVGKIQVQLEQAKRELKNMRFTLGPTMTKVTVEKFDAENKRFPIRVSSLDDSLPFEASLFFKIDSTDRNVLQRGYRRVDDAQKANALIGTIYYTLEEFAPSIWVGKVGSASILSLLEGGSGNPVELIQSDRSEFVESKDVPYLIENGTIAHVFGILPVRSSKGPVFMYTIGDEFLGKVDEDNLVFVIVNTPEDAKGKRLTFETVDGKKSMSMSGDIKQGINDIFVPRFFYQVGDFGPSGGYIFYDKGSYSDDWRYLEVAPPGWSGNAEDPSVDWGDPGMFLGTGAAIGAGAGNTERLVAKMGDTKSIFYKIDYPAKMCSDLVIVQDGVVYDDWFLPSKDELKMIFTIHVQSELGLSKEEYWSSSEYNERLTWYQSYGGGDLVYERFSSRYPAFRVRPGRAF
jgi:hypothetical protein